MPKKYALLTLAVLAAGISQAAEIYNNGPVVNDSGKSVVAAPNTTLGFNDKSGLFSVADDFIVGEGAQWTVAGIDFFGFQNNAGGFTFQTATWSIVSGDVNSGAVLFTGTTALTNGGLVGYRVTPTTLNSSVRTIYRAQADITDLTLDAGHYWLRWSLTGSLPSGPWQPPTSDGQVGNAMNAAFGGSFSTLVDGGLERAVYLSLPFALHGAVVAVPEPTSYALMLAGGLGVMAIVRRRRQQQG